MKCILKSDSLRFILNMYILSECFICVVQLFYFMNNTNFNLQGNFDKVQYHPIVI